MKESHRVLFCQCTQAKIIAPEVRNEVLNRLSTAGIAFGVTADLCGLAARRDPVLARYAEAEQLSIVGCFPRAVKWLFHAAGVPLADRQVRVLNMRRQSAEEIVSGLLANGAPRVEGGQPQIEPVGEAVCACRGGAWYPWFPVIDFDGCTNCMQCLSFCLFDVFDLDDGGQVRVEKPENCKRDCPACARVCPEVAIIFPKYERGPVNGDEVREEDLRREPVKVDVAALVRGNAHAALRARGRGQRERFAVERECCCSQEQGSPPLEEVQRELGIPDEVLESLTTRCCGEDGVERAEPGPAERSAVPEAAGGRADAPSAEEWDI